MAEPAPTPAEIRADLVVRIARIDAHLASGLTESREEDEQAKWNLGEMRQTRNELQARLDAMDGGTPNASRVRQIRMISRKGY